MATLSVLRRAGWAASRRAWPRPGAAGCRSMTAVRAMSTFKYLPSHEYVKMEGKVGTFGISDFAQAQLGDVVYVDLPEVGDEVEAGSSFGSVESVKAASDVYAPLSGKVTAVNEALAETPELVNSHAMDDAWFVKIELTDNHESEAAELLDEEAYQKMCEEASE